VNGQAYWFVESNPPARLKHPIIHLLPNYDEYFIGFRDRGAIGERLGSSSLKTEDSTFLTHLVFVDGQLVGGWKRILEKNKVIIELNLVMPLPKDEKHAVKDETERFGIFLGLHIELKERGA
jgi:hypothetical protein